MTSDLAGGSAPLELRPAAGRPGREDPAVLLGGPAADLLQSDLLLSSAPQLLLHLLNLRVI